jgi:hypothetical protein
MPMRACLSTYLLLLLCFASACEQTTLEWTEADSPFLPEVAVIEVVEEEIAVGEGPLGAACTKGEDCLTGTCLTGDYFTDAGLDNGFDFTGGMCSISGCTVDSDCGDGAVCQAPVPFAGQPICIKTCRDVHDCRWDENYTCYTGVGYVTNAQEGDAAGVCLPKAVAAAGTPTGEGWVGVTCTDATGADDCENNLCVTDDYLILMGLEGVSIPTGMCSALFCTSDAACGPSGFCFNAAPLTGEPPEEATKLCLRECTQHGECRWEEGYSCYALTTFPAEGEEGPPTVQNPGACLPDSLVDVIVCDDGHCDEEVAP